MATAEFDAVADRYLDLHRENIRLSGEEPEYFARSKIQALRRLWTQRGLCEPGRVLDFGCGVGASLPHLASAFPKAEIVGADVSEASLELAARRAPFADLRLYDGKNLLRGVPGPFDLAFTACVLHHIAAEAHEGLLGQLRESLVPGGALMVYEHNRLNPVTRHIVATCPFDENAVLLGAGLLKRRLKAAGFKSVEIVYTGFFPGPLARLRPLEPLLGWLPAGAQYYALAWR